jgi:tRNA nucleotidyltransferase (CCA-adding enzyme)
MDLYRRDFTVNALAVCLNGARYGELLDFFGGQQDLRDKTLRIIHNLSFVEDPTRLLRAARFEIRFGLHLSRHAEQLSANAVKMGLLDKVAGPRVFTELQLILREPRPWAILRRLEALGALAAIHPRFALGRTTEQRLQRVGEVLTWYNLLYLPAQPAPWLVHLLVLLEERPSPEARAILRRLGPPPRSADVVVRDLARLRTLARSLQRAREVAPSRMYRWLAGASVEMVLALMAVVGRPELRKAIGDFLSASGRVRPTLRGDDLRALGIQPGPVYRDILTSLLYARLDGHVQSRDDELRFVRRRFARAFPAEMVRPAKAPRTRSARPGD